MNYHIDAVCYFTICSVAKILAALNKFLTEIISDKLKKTSDDFTSKWFGHNDHIAGLLLELLFVKKHISAKKRIILKWQ